MAVFTSRLFSLGPRIEKRSERLHVRTGWRVWLFSLGLCNREVIVDPEKRVLRIKDRLFWFFPKKKSIKFDHIRAIAYGYSDPNSFGGFNMVRDTFDVYRVGLMLHGDYDNYQHLFRFMGEGPFVNDGPFPNWFYWEEYLMDLEGTQMSESKLLVELLMKMVGAKLEAI